MSITVGDYVRTTEEYNSLCSISGEVIEDYGNKVVIIDDAALNQTNLLCLSLSLSTKFGILDFIFWVGNFSPITPVEANKISLGLITFVVPSSF